MLRTVRRHELRGPHREHHAVGDQPTPKTHPRLFAADGQLRWRVPPGNVKPEDIHPHAPVPGATYNEWWFRPYTKNELERIADGQKVPQVKIYGYPLKDIEKRVGEKFVANRKLAEQLPALREKMGNDLQQGNRRDRQVALALMVIDKMYLRVGSEHSARDRHHFGTTTLQKQHVELDGDTVKLSFVGKSGVVWDAKETDPDLAQAMRQRLRAARGPASPLFGIHARDVNEYLAPFGFTAKQFRTFHASRLAKDYLLEHTDAPPAKRDQIIDTMIDRVAKKLGHEPGTCRAHYIDPMVLKAFKLGRLTKAFKLGTRL